MVGDGVLPIRKYFIFKGYKSASHSVKIWVVTGMDFQ